MGNICCQEPPSQPRQRKQIVPTYSKDNSYKPTFKTAQEQQLEQQRMLLHEFSYAVRNLNNNQFNRPKTIYKGVYTHNLITSDQISEYFNATLVNENDQLEPSVVKKILKERLRTLDLKRSLVIEYLVTSQHQSNFLVRSIFHYEDSGYLSLYYDLSKYFHLNLFMNNPQCNQYFRFNLENNIRFIIAGVILGLQELHSLQIVYRGVNFENIVIREDGYPLLTNLSNLHPQGNSVNIASSTPFTSPQQLRNQIVSKSADFWSLGVLIFYMITGRYPNPFSNQQRQFNVLGVSLQLCDLINKLLIIDPQQRLGAYNINDLKAHAFFYAFDWNKYWNLDLISPFSREQNKVFSSIEEQHHQCHEQSRFDYSGSTGLIAGMLFMEVGTILLLSNLYEQEYLHEQHEINNNQNMHSGNLASNYFDHGCEIELSDDGHVEDAGGGDYD